MKKRNSLKKRNLLKKIIILIILSIVMFKINPFNIVKNLSLNKNIYNFLNDEKNRRETYLAAIDLHNGDSENTCVFFTAEVLRRNKYDIPKYMANTKAFIGFLENKGWKKNFNYKDLKPGDICFTTDEHGNKQGIPTHVYIFMGWVEEGNYNYAYICDNQAKDYKNQVYHTRNINIIDKANGYKKDAFSYFMEI